MDKNFRKQLGIWDTQKSPFDLIRVQVWLKEIKKLGLAVCEPFAGQGNLVRMLPDVNWRGMYDINPRPSNFDILTTDCLRSFPTHSSEGQRFGAAITNPPWLSKNSAAQNRLNYDPNFKFDDLYKQALFQCLENCDFLLAILPESFVKSGLFRDRMVSIIRLNSSIFGKSTEHPTCVALFEKKISDDFEIWEDEKYLGMYSKLNSHAVSIMAEEEILRFQFNAQDGEIIMHGLDTRAGPTIFFCIATEIDKYQVKRTDRHNCKIKIPFQVSNSELKNILKKANDILTDYRASTCDVGLSSTKSRRNNGHHRRRLDFDLARRIITLASR